MISPPKGVPLTLARTDIGYLPIQSTMHVVKNTKNPDLAAAYINAAIRPDVQQKMSEAPNFFVPTDEKVQFSKGVQTWAKNMNELQKFKTVDWAKLTPRRGEYIDGFN